MKLKNLPPKSATKEDLKLLEHALREELLKLEEKIDQKAQNYRDEILTALDGVMGELKTMREETIIGAHQLRELGKEVDDHEVRIANLEKPL